MKTTLLTNIYNEEYLLPFWLHHHKNMFDDIIIINYSSNDSSLEICKQICPNCTILNTINSHFDAENIDIEFMNIENNVDGIKIVLNTTEFLFSDKPIKEIFSMYENETSKSLEINCYSPYSKKVYNINNYYDLMSNLLNTDIKYHCDRHKRYIHSFNNGNYGIGRHSTNNHLQYVDCMHIIWFGYYPLNNKLLQRKLQIQQNISERDKKRGFGIQHLFSKKQLFTINSEKVETGTHLNELNPILYKYLYNKYKNKTFIVTGGCGFIGSHMVDKLVELNYNVIVLDNNLSGNNYNENRNVVYENIDIRDNNKLDELIRNYEHIDGIFHFAAIARTPWCIDDPILCYSTNVMGTLNILEISRKYNISRVVLSSSNVVYAFKTPYRSSKETLESLAEVYDKMYGMSVISLRYSNVYGPRQSEDGPSPNVFASLRKSKRELGKLIITGDGEQTRNYTHVSDIVLGNLLAMFNDYCGVLDLCTGVSISLNQVSKYFNCPVEYIDERPGDVKHIIQNPNEAFRVLSWKFEKSLEDGIIDVLE